MAVTWEAGESTTALNPAGAIGKKIKVNGETGGAWLLPTDSYGPCLAWMPSSEGVLNFMVKAGMVAQILDANGNQAEITQEAFDELTDTSKWGYIRIVHGKPA